MLYQIKRSRLASIELIKAAEEAEKDLADAVSEVNKSIREDDELDQEIENGFQITTTILKD